MGTTKMGIVAIAVGMALSTGAAAMSKDEHRQGKGRIASEHKADRAACDSAMGNARDICRAEADGKESVAKAELENTYKGTRETRYDLRVAKANAEFGVAKERCDDHQGNAKDVCMKEAKAVQTSAKADARAAMQSGDAKQAAREEIAEAHAKATDKVTRADKDAAADKRAAELKLAYAKCDALSGAMKESCKGDAKAHYGKM